MSYSYQEVCSYWDITHIEESDEGLSYWCRAATGPYNPKLMHHESYSNPMRIKASSFDSVRGVIRAMATIGARPTRNDKRTHLDCLAWANFCIDEANKQGAAQKPYKVTGWMDDNQGFCFGTAHTDMDGETHVGRPVGPLEKIAKAALVDSNNVNEATTQLLIADLYRDHANAVGKLAFVCAFAAPFMRFTEAGRMVLNFTGPTGIGKTALHQLVTSQWGCPMDGYITANSTTNSKRERVSILKDLPVVMDEATIDMEGLRDIIFEDGIQRGRLDSTGAMQDAKDRWTGLLITSSNASLFDHLSGTLKDKAEAISARFVEIPMETQALPIKYHAEARRIQRLTYGWTAPHFVQTVCGRDFKAITDMYRLIERHWLEGRRIPNYSTKSRKWLSFFACIEATCMVLENTILAKRWNIQADWSKHLLPLCKELYVHNLTRFSHNDIRSMLRGMSADFEEWQIDMRQGQGPFPMGRQVLSGVQPKSQLAMVGVDTIWTIRQTTFDKYVRDTLRDVTVGTILSDAKRQDALLLPQRGGNTHSIALGTGSASPCYQFKI